MSHQETSNLIDLSIENNQTVQHVHSVQVFSPENIMLNNAFVKRDSLDNNPFDGASKQVNLCDDPFESVSRKAEQQRHTTLGAPDVQTENLLGLDEEVQDPDGRIEYLAVTPHGSRFGSSRSTALSSISSLNSIASPGIYNDSVFCSNVSPIPVQAPSGTSMILNNAFITDNSGKELVNLTESPRLENSSFEKANSRRFSNSSGSALSDGSKKLSGEFSALNAAHGSSSILTHLLKLSLSNSPSGSPFRRRSKTSDDSGEVTIFSEAGYLAEQFSKFANSGCSDSCDDINALKPNWVDSETDLDSDLELLRIPMLQQIENEIEQQRTPGSTNKKAIELLEKHRQETVAQRATTAKSIEEVLDLEAIRDKVIRHKLERDDSQDVDDLINSLKQIVFECSNGDQKIKANELLESLSTLLSKTSDASEHNEPATLSNASELPLSIVRQATFYLDKVPKEEASPQEVVLEPEPQPQQKDCVSPPNLSPEVSNIAEQLGKLLGSQTAVNVVQANLGTSSAAATNPTYIVVMQNPVALPFTPIRQKTQIIMSSTSSPDFEVQKRSRSNSLSLHDKPIKRPTVSTPSSASIYNTPIRSNMQRRSSISSYSPSASFANSRIIRKPIYEPPTQQQPTVERRTSLLTHHHDVPPPKVIPKNISNIKAEPNVKKLKLKTIEMSRRTIGPLKATIPLKKVAPMIITPSISSPIKSDKKTKLITSTPTPVVNSITAFPTACSTPRPAPNLSPPKNSLKIKQRYSYMSTTPNPKSSIVKPTSSSYNRRRSLTDSNSPKRSVTGRTSIAAGANNIRRFTSSKLGFGAPKCNSIADKNKENAHIK